MVGKVLQAARDARRDIARVRLTATLLACAVVAASCVLAHRLVPPGLPWHLDPLFLAGAIGGPAFLLLALLAWRGHVAAARLSFLFVAFDVAWLAGGLLVRQGVHVGAFLPVLAVAAAASAGSRRGAWTLALADLAGLAVLAAAAPVAWSAWAVHAVVAAGATAARSPWPRRRIEPSRPTEAAGE